MERNYLFNKYDWHSVQEGQRNKIIEDVNSLDSERVLGTPAEDLAVYFEEKHTLEVPVLQRDNAVADQNEKEIDVSHDRMRMWSTPGPHYITGTEVTLLVPFTGNPELFDVQPTTYTSNPPTAEIRGNNLLLRIAGTSLETVKVKQELDTTLGKIGSYLANLSNSAKAHNSSIRNLALQILERRREKLLADKNLVSELGFPLRERSGNAKTYAAPSVKKKIKPQLPPKSSSPFKPEPALAQGDYEHIISVLENMVDVMERSPSAFETMDEEALRSHFLVQLNGHYEGQATGETFNYSGKTDILLRVDEKNVFIGECKYWSGPKKLYDTLDQLLSYSCWRDSKVALIIFNRKKNFSKVLEVISPTISTHPNFKREIQVEGETKFRYIIAHRDDPAKELTVTVLAFDVPNKTKPNQKGDDNSE